MNIWFPLWVLSLGVHLSALLFFTPARLRRMAKGDEERFQVLLLRTTRVGLAAAVLTVLFLFLAFATTR